MPGDGTSLPRKSIVKDNLVQGLLSGRSARLLWVSQDQDLRGDVCRRQVQQPGKPPDLKARDPAGSHAVRQRSQRHMRPGDLGLVFLHIQRPVQPLVHLVDRLNDSEAEIRLLAILALDKTTGTTCGYRYYEPPERRAEAVARWRRWLLSRAPNPPAATQPTTQSAAGVAEGGDSDEELL